MILGRETEVNIGILHSDIQEIREAEANNTETLGVVMKLLDDIGKTLETMAKTPESKLTAAEKVYHIL